MSKNIVDRWFDAFRNRDAGALENELAEDFVHTSPFGEVHGRETYIDLVKQNENAFFDHTIEIIDVIEESNKVAVRYLIDGRPSCDCIYVENDRIACIHAYYHYGAPPSFESL